MNLQEGVLNDRCRRRRGNDDDDDDDKIRTIDDVEGWDCIIKVLLGEEGVLKK